MFTIQRTEDRTRVIFSVYEDGVTWPNSDQPRSASEVEVWKPSDFREEAEVSYPSTSDKRPELARAVAEAMLMAVREAERLTVKGVQPEEEPDVDPIIEMVTAAAGDAKVSVEPSAIQGSPYDHVHVYFSEKEGEGPHLIISSAKERGEEEGWDVGGYRGDEHLTGDPAVTMDRLADASAVASALPALRAKLLTFV